MSSGPSSIACHPFQPVRLSSDTREFIVRSPFAKSSADFAVFYALRSLTVKGNKRELVIAKSHAYILGPMDSTSDLAAGEVPVTITRYCEHSLKIVPTQPLRRGEYALSSRSAEPVLLRSRRVPYHPEPHSRHTY